MNNGEAELRPELGHGERLLWSGRPRQGLRLRQSDLFMVPVSLMWGGFAFFWEGASTAKGAPFLFTLMGIPFVLVGIYIIVGRFFADSYLRKRTFYGVTDQRVIIVSAGFKGREVKSLSLQGLSEINLKESADRGGTITFGPSNSYFQESARGWPGSKRMATPAFELLDEVRKVYDIVREAQRVALGRRVD